MSIGGWGNTAVAQLNDWGGNGDAAAELDSFDADGVSTAGGGGPIDVEGAYHLEVADASWDEKDNNFGRKQMTVRLVALHSTPGLSPAGSVIWHHVEIPNAEDRDKPVGKSGTVFDLLLASICTFCGGMGLFRKVTVNGKEVWHDTATNSTKLQLSTLPQRLKDLQVIGRPKWRMWGENQDGTPKLDKSGKPGKTLEFQYGRGFSHIGDPQNAMIPINEEAATAAGLARYVAPPTKPAKGGRGAVGTAAAPATQPAGASNQMAPQATQAARPAAATQAPAASAPVQQAPATTAIPVDDDDL